MTFTNIPPLSLSLTLESIFDHIGYRVSAIGNTKSDRVALSTRFPFFPVFLIFIHIYTFYEQIRVELKINIYLLVNLEFSIPIQR